MWISLISIMGISLNTYPNLSLKILLILDGFDFVSMLSTSIVLSLVSTWLVYLSQN